MIFVANRLQKKKNYSVEREKKEKKQINNNEITIKKQINKDINQIVRLFVQYIKNETRHRVKIYRIS